MLRLLALLAVVAVGCTTSGGSVTATNPEPEERRSASPNVPKPGHPVQMPAKLIADRFYVEPTTVDGNSLRLFTDTGGGLMLTKAAATRLGLETSTIEADEGPTEAAFLPNFEWDSWIPKVEVFDGRLPIVEESPLTKTIDPEMDGMLGQAWFKDRVWTFDYENGELWLRASGDLPKHDPSQRAFLGFPKNAEGKRATNYPRIEVQIDGAKVDLLFDTGATVKLSPAAVAAMGDGGPPVRATSFIAATTFDQWKQKHPDWRIIENADVNADGAPMIQVPAVTVAGQAVGPVWFTRRSDKDFHEWMSQWTDKRIDGALGGNALRFFRISIDYPRAMAVFERIAK
ncbi:MAG: hypothetical protein HOW73_10140 [Polyangiaceae bacterium]|nr:hypothetical protein [Polyangiaceae bacterium]